METRTFGKLGPVSALTLGGGGTGGVWGATTREEAVETVRAAVDGGITFLDVAPGYGNGEAERVVGEAFGGRLPEGVRISTKHHLGNVPRGGGGGGAAAGAGGEPRPAAAGARRPLLPARDDRPGRVRGAGNAPQPVRGGRAARVRGDGGGRDDRGLGGERRGRAERAFGVAGGGSGAGRHPVRSQPARFAGRDARLRRGTAAARADRGGGNDGAWA